MKKKTILQRILLYIVLMGLGGFIPYVITMLMVIISNSQKGGLAYGTLSSPLLIHLVFSLIFLQTEVHTKLITALCTSVTSIVILVILNALHCPNPFQYIFKFDGYGFWSFFAAYIIISIITWEIAYHILLKITARKSHE